MKRIFLTALMILMMTLPAWAVQDWLLPSTTKTDSAAIITTSGFCGGITVITDGTNTATVDIYDNASAASGTKIIPTWYVTSSSTNRAQTYNIFPPVKVNNGIYVNLSVAGGGSASYMVYYSF
jgi:hypothetical protein